MTRDSTARLYDEDSVFRRLFEDEEKPEKANKPVGMEQANSDADTTEMPIRVSDFLPRY